MTPAYYASGVMDVYRTAAAAIAAVAVFVGAAGCGGGHKKAATPSTTVSAATPAQQRAEVKTVWESFFAGSTSASQKTALLESGSSLAKIIGVAVKSPLAKQLSAKVISVTLTGPSKATVLYTLELARKPVLQHQTGTAVKAGGSWKVGLASFCKLLKLEGAHPAACTQTG